MWIQEGVVIVVQCSSQCRLALGMEQTARVISQLGGKDQSSKEFQNLIRQIGEAKTKHVSDNTL